MPENDKLSIIVVYACFVHVIFATALLMDESAVGITAVHAVVTLVWYPISAAGFFLGAGTLAIVGLGAQGTKMAIILLAPQQFLLIVSAGGAIYAMATGTFADGTVRSHWFLLADQSPAVAAALCHTIALYRMGARPWKADR